MANIVKAQWPRFRDVAMWTDDGKDHSTMDRHQKNFRGKNRVMEPVRTVIRNVRKEWTSDKDTLQTAEDTGWQLRRRLEIRSCVGVKSWPDSLSKPYPRHRN